MGILLKSLFSVSRSTPSYRLARKQGPDTFVICYRIYQGEPQYGHLGDGYQDTRVGVVSTPLGTFALSVAYRTKMLISPHTSTKDLCEDVRENHFNSECSPRKGKVNSPQPCHNGFRERRYLSLSQLTAALSQWLPGTKVSITKSTHRSHVTTASGNEGIYH